MEQPLQKKAWDAIDSYVTMKHAASIMGDGNMAEISHMNYGDKNEGNCNIWSCLTYCLKPTITSVNILD